MSSQIENKPNMKMESKSFKILVKKTKETIYCLKKE